MSKTLDLLTRLSPTGTPIGTCDSCGNRGPLKESEFDGGKQFICIPCEIDFSELERSA